MNNNLLDLISRLFGGSMPPGPQNRNEAAGTIRGTPAAPASLISQMMYASPSKSGMQTQGLMDKLYSLLYSGRLPYEDKNVGSFNTTGGPDTVGRS